MTNIFPNTPATWSYAIATIAFAAYSLRGALAWRRGGRQNGLLVALICSMVWAACTWSALATHSAFVWWIATLLDIVRIAAWLAFLIILLDGSYEPASVSISPAAKLKRVMICAFLLVVAIAFPQQPPWQTIFTASFNWAFVSQLGLAIYGLSLVEQLYRRTPESRRWAVKPLVIGLGGMFALDLLMYTGGILFHQVDTTIWAARGIANAAVLVMVALATRRTKSWAVELHVSHQVVFQSTAVFIVGIYLLIVASGGYWVHFFGREWGGTLQVALFFATALALTTLAFSGAARARLKVFISKNLFSYRYDYRSEWLRFTSALGTTEPGETIYQQVIRALANLVEGNGGALWLKQDGNFNNVAIVNFPFASAQEEDWASLITFLSRTGWVIRVDECKVSPAAYAGLSLPQSLSSNSRAWLVLPLASAGNLIAFVVLARPLAPLDVNWEVRDLLKTAGSQAAIAISQVRATETLVETEKFAAFNRMSAFVVHDLKNIVAQLGLLLKNAERHQDNPDFRRDMFETVRNSVDRMNQLMLQLRSGTSPVEKASAVDLTAVVQSVLSGKGQKREEVRANLAAGIRVHAHRDRIERVIGHIVQNAIEASVDAVDSVRLRTSADAEFALVEVTDSGIGMTEEFVQKRLFHPFQTTKSQGMGIGMYESFHYIHGIGGRIMVKSVPNEGTQLKLFIPLAGADTIVGDSSR